MIYLFNAAAKRIIKTAISDKKSTFTVNETVANLLIQQRTTKAKLKRGRNKSSR